MKHFKSTFRVESMELSLKTGDVGKMQSTEHKKEKEANRAMEIMMALHVLRHICSDIAKNGFFTIMADECTDVSNKERFVISIHWVDNILTAHNHRLTVHC